MIEVMCLRVGLFEVVRVTQPHILSIKGTKCFCRHEIFPLLENQVIVVLVHLGDVAFHHFTAHRLILCVLLIANF